MRLRVVFATVLAFILIVIAAPASIRRMTMPRQRFPRLPTLRQQAPPLPRPMPLDARLLGGSPA